MPRPNNSIPAQLNTAQVAITNTLADPEIQALVAAYGYDVTKMNAGKALYEAALVKVNAQAAAAGAQQQTTLALKDAEQTAHTAYQDLAKVARAVFVDNPAALAALGLNAAMPRTIAGFLAAGYALFDNALNTAPIRTALAGYGYPQAKLQSERAKIAALDAANQAQETAKGAAQQATQEQDAALKAMNEWVAQYIKIARVALRGKKQLLEKLGVPARTTLTKAQRAARAKKKTPAVS